MATPAATVAKVGLVMAGAAFGLTVKPSAKGALVPAALVALNVVLNDPLAVGVPLMAPLVVLRLRPAGNALGATTA